MLVKEPGNSKFMESLSVEPKVTRLIFPSTKLTKKLFFFFLFFLFITRAGAMEYTVSPFPSDQSGASLAGEKVTELEVTTIPYWQFLLWLAAMNVLSALDMLLYPTKLIFVILGFKIKGHASVLDNPNRSSIYEYIKASPGIYFSEIVEKIGLDRGTVRYHVKTLEAQNKVEVYKDGRKMRYFQNNFTYNEEEKKVISVLQNNTNQRIISEILNGNCTTNVTLAQEIGVSKSTISWYVGNLKEIGLIKEAKKGRNIIYRINPSYETLIEEYE